MTQQPPPFALPVLPAAVVEPEHFYENTVWRLVSQLIWAGFMVLILLGVWVYGAVAIGSFGKVFALPEDLLRQAFPLVLLVPPMVMIVAAGGLDLSVGAVAALSSTMIALMLSKGGHPGLAVAVALLVAVGIGLVNGALVGLLRVPGALVTLAMVILLRGVAMVLCEGRTIYAGIEGPTFLESMSRSMWVWWLIVLYVAGCAVLVQLTPFGRRPRPRRAVRESWALRAAFVGPPYVLSSLMAGLVGAYYVGWMRAGGPIIGLDVHIGVLFAVALGGMCLWGRCGSVLGGVFAVAVVVFLQRIFAMAGHSSYAQRILVGAGILIGALNSQLYYGLIDLVFVQRRRRARPLAVPPAPPPRA